MKSDCFERLFAQKLSSADAGVRGRAFRLLQDWLQEHCQSGELFTRDSLLNVWQGLYYCFWMQDRPLIQEELADKIGGLGAYLFPFKQQLLFYDVFFKQIGLEWYSIDRWRMNKFLMLVRRFFRGMLSQLKRLDWERKAVIRLLNMLTKTVLSPKSTGCPIGLKMHFASIYLDELDFIGGDNLRPDQTTLFLLPYFRLLKNNIEDALFDTVIRELFQAVLLVSSPEPSTNNATGHSESESSLKFDFKLIAQKLFAVGKRKEFPDRRRQQIYGLVKKFEQVANSEDPFYEEYSSGSDVDDELIDKAAQNIVAKKTTSKKPTDRKKPKRSRERISDRAIEVMPEIAESLETKMKKPKDLKYQRGRSKKALKLETTSKPLRLVKKTKFKRKSYKKISFIV